MPLNAYVANEAVCECCSAARGRIHPNYHSVGTAATGAGPGLASIQTARTRGLSSVQHRGIATGTCGTESGLYDGWMLFSDGWFLVW